MPGHHLPQRSEIQRLAVFGYGIVKIGEDPVQLADNDILVIAFVTDYSDAAIAWVVTIGKNFPALCQLASACQ